MGEYNTYIEGLIIKSIRGLISAEEENELDSWLNEDPGNHDFYKRISSEENLYNKLSDFNAIDIDVALKKNKTLIKKRTFKKRVISIIPYAAAVMAILIALPFIIKEKEIPVVKTAEVISAGSSKAVLVLGDGSVVNLCETLDKSIKEADGAMIEIKDNSVEYKASKLNKKIVYNTIKTPRGGEYNLTLSDGTKVWINSDSEIKYPASFSKKKRVVSVKGEVYFDVSHNKEKPFIVSTSKGKIKVLGTSFNVRVYDDEKEFVTTLVDGKVRLRKGKDKVVLTPGKQAVISDSDDIKIKDVDIDIYTAWKDGRFIFRRQSLGEIMNTLSRWYDVNVFFDDNSAREVLFSGNVERYDKFEKIIDMVEMMNKVKFRVKGNTVWVSKK